jgi:hypothetical protein
VSPATDYFEAFGNVYLKDENLGLWSDIMNSISVHVSPRFLQISEVSGGMTGGNEGLTDVSGGWRD